MEKKALVVDDSRVARMSLKKAILVHEFDITEFANAEEVLSYLQTTNDKPNIIFMDLMMDGMDGLSATKQIKTMEGCADIPIVICSGNSAEIDINHAKAAGAMEILSKPPEPTAVANIIQQVSDIAAVEVLQTPVEKVTPPADKSVMTEKVVELIEHKLMAKIEKDFSQLAEDISRRNITEVVETSLKEQVQKVLNDLIPSVSQQLISEAIQGNQHVIQSSIDDVIKQRLPQAIEAATAKINISQQVEASLSQQEVVMQQRISHEVQQEAMKATEQYIDNSLAAMIAPLVTMQVEQELQNQNTAPNERIQALETRISKLERIVMALGIAIVILAILLFI